MPFSSFFSLSLGLDWFVLYGYNDRIITHGVAYFLDLRANKLHGPLFGILDQRRCFLGSIRKYIPSVLLCKTLRK